MQARLNHLGQPVGPALPGWKPVPRPPRTPMEGRFCRVEPIDPARHGDDLFAAFAEDRDGATFTYLGAGPFADRAAFDAWMGATCLGDDPMFHAIVDRSTGRALGVAAYMRIEPAVGVIEVGHVNFSLAMQRGTIATEAMYLMMRRVFEELAAATPPGTRCSIANGRRCAVPMIAGWHPRTSTPMDASACPWAN